MAILLHKVRNIGQASQQFNKIDRARNIDFFRTDFWGEASLSGQFDRRGE